MASLGHVFLDELSSRSFCLFVSTMRLGTLPPNHPFVLSVYMNTYTHTLLLLLFSYFRSSRGVGITKSHFRYVRPDSCVRSARPLKRDNQGPPIMGPARLDDPICHRRSPHSGPLCLTALPKFWPARFAWLNPLRGEPCSMQAYDHTESPPASRNVTLRPHHGVS